MVCIFKWKTRKHGNWPNSQIPEGTCSISHNASFRTEMCTFLFWMEHCGIWNRCIGIFEIGLFDVELHDPVLDQGQCSEISQINSICSWAMWYLLFNNSLLPNDTIWRHRCMSTLIQIITCYPIWCKFVFKPMLTYCQLGPQEQSLVQF